MLQHSVAVFDVAVIYGLAARRLLIQRGKRARAPPRRLFESDEAVPAPIRLNWFCLPWIVRSQHEVEHRLAASATSSYDVHSAEPGPSCVSAYARDIYASESIRTSPSFFQGSGERTAAWESATLDTPGDCKEDCRLQVLCAHRLFLFNPAASHGCSTEGRALSTS